MVNSWHWTFSSCYATVNKCVPLACLNSTCLFLEMPQHISNTVMSVLSTTCWLSFSICSLGTLSRSEAIAQKTDSEALVSDNFCKEFSKINFIMQLYERFTFLTYCRSKNCTSNLSSVYSMCSSIAHNHVLFQNYISLIYHYHI